MNLITLKEKACQSHSDQKLFGLCDDMPPAKINEDRGEAWIAVVVNEYLFDTTFTAVDHCIETIRDDGIMDNRCDGILSYNTTIIFVELKQQGGKKSNDWIKHAETQLKASIRYFEKNLDADDYTVKKAYIANSEHPKFKYTQAARMEKFRLDTGYILRIENRIILT